MICRFAPKISSCVKWFSLRSMPLPYHETALSMISIVEHLEACVSTFEKEKDLQSTEESNKLLEKTAYLWQGEGYMAGQIRSSAVE